MRYTQSNVAFCDFTVAWSEKYKEAETKCFLRCRAWRSTGEFLGKYFKKGQELVIEGRMQTEEWEKDGQKHSMMMCLAEKVNFCGPKKEGSNNPTPPPEYDDGFVNVPEGIDEELPFS